MLNLSVFQTVLLAVFGALAIAGILVFALLVSGSRGNAIGPVAIWGTLDPAAFTVVIRQATEDDSRLSQVVYTQKDEATYQSDLTNALASGKGPDLFLLRQDYALKDAEKVIPIPYGTLSRSQFENTFVEGALPFLDEKGVLGVPLFVDPLVLYWNRDMLASAGIATPPRYWDEFPVAVEKLTKRDDAGSILKSGVAFGEYQNVLHAKDIVSAQILQAGGRITAEDNAGNLIPAFGSRLGESSQPTESALRFYTEFADPSKVDYSWNRSLPDSRAAFAAGDLALYVGYASEKSLISRTNPNLNFALAPMPQIRSAERATNAGRVYALAAARTTSKPQSAITVAFVLASSDIAKSLSLALGMPGARRDVLAGPLEGDDDLFARQALIVRSWKDPDPEKTAAVFRGMIESVTTGAARVAEAIQRADQEMGQILGL